MKLTVPPLDIKADEGFSPDKDIFNRKEIGESLLNMIKNANDELVIALDAPWGEGKTTFVKMWRGYLADNNIKSIYFDAFKNDYQKDPFFAVSSQIYQLIESQDEKEKNEYKKRAVSALKTIGRAGLRIGIKALTSGVLDETVFEDTGTVKDVSQETSKIIDGYISKRIESANQDRENLNCFRIYIEALAKKLGKGSPIIFIVDELDRCKPNFALELLESIKHLFSVKNIVFVLVMNREQLEESVRSEYGVGVDSSRYLQKFISLWTNLSKSKDRHDNSINKYLHNCLDRMEFETKTGNQQQCIENYEELANYYNLSLREIEKSLTYFSIISNTTSEKIEIDHQWLSVYLAIVKVIYPNTYNKIASATITYDELINETNIVKLYDKYWEDKPEHHPLRWLLRYYLSDNEKLTEFLKQGDFSGNRFGRRNGGIEAVCKLLEIYKVT